MDISVHGMKWKSKTSSCDIWFDDCFPKRIRGFAWGDGIDWAQPFWSSVDSLATLSTRSVSSRHRISNQGLRHLPWHSLQPDFRSQHHLVAPVTVLVPASPSDRQIDPLGYPKRAMLSKTTTNEGLRHHPWHSLQPSFLVNTVHRRQGV